MAKESKASRSVSGEWFGNYYYAGASDSFGFEAVFIESGGSVEGNILDDGRLGEARVAGTFSYPSLKFTKSYRTGQHPVEYQGTMSEDGNALSGTWTIKANLGISAGGGSSIVATTNGSWTAWRNLEDEDEDTLDTEDEVEVETEKPMVAPMKGG